MVVVLLADGDSPSALDQTVPGAGDPRPADLVIPPGGDVAAGIRSVGPGGVVELMPGDHGDVTLLGAGDTEGPPVVLRAREPAEWRRVWSTIARERYEVQDGGVTPQSFAGTWSTTVGDLLVEGMAVQVVGLGVRGRVSTDRADVLFDQVISASPDNSWVLGEGQVTVSRSVLAWPGLVGLDRMVVEDSGALELDTVMLGNAFSGPGADRAASALRVHEGGMLEVRRAALVASSSPVVLEGADRGTLSVSDSFVESFDSHRSRGGFIQAGATAAASSVAMVIEGHPPTFEDVTVDGVLDVTGTASPADVTGGAVLAVRGSEEQFPHDAATGPAASRERPTTPEELSPPDAASGSDAATPGPDHGSAMQYAEPADIVIDAGADLMAAILAVGPGGVVEIGPGHVGDVVLDQAPEDGDWDEPVTVRASVPADWRAAWRIVASEDYVVQDGQVAPKTFDGIWSTSFGELDVEVGPIRFVGFGYGGTVRVRGARADFDVVVAASPTTRWYPRSNFSLTRASLAWPGVVESGDRLQVGEGDEEDSSGRRVVIDQAQIGNIFRESGSDAHTDALQTLTDATVIVRRSSLLASSNRVQLSVLGPGSAFQDTYIESIEDARRRGYFIPAGADDSGTNIALMADGRSPKLERVEVNGSVFDKGASESFIVEDSLIRTYRGSFGDGRWQGSTVEFSTEDGLPDEYGNRSGPVDPDRPGPP